MNLSETIKKKLNSYKMYQTTMKNFPQTLFIYLFQISSDFLSKTAQNYSIQTKRGKTIHLGMNCT